MTAAAAPEAAGNTAGEGRHSPAVAEAAAGWQRRQRRRWEYGTIACLALLLAIFAAGRMVDFEAATLWAGLPRIGEYFERITPHLSGPLLFAGSQTDGSLAYWYYGLWRWLLLLLQTAQMAVVATLIGAASGLVLGFCAARSLAPYPWACLLVRRAMEALRTVPDIVFALIMVWAFGVGPLPGVIALALHSTGALAKQYAEVLENAPLGAFRAVEAAGGSWPEACRFGLLPQLAPAFWSYGLLRLEINLRSASVIGFVGAGGIGEELYTAIASNYYSDISAILILIALVVMALDMTSDRLRRKLAAV